MANATKTTKKFITDEVALKLFKAGASGFENKFAPAICPVFMGLVERGMEHKKMMAMMNEWQKGYNAAKHEFMKAKFPELYV